MLKIPVTYSSGFFQNLVRAKCSLSDYFDHFAGAECVVENLGVDQVARGEIDPRVDKILSVTNHPLGEEFQLFEQHTNVVGDHFDVGVIEAVVKQAFPFLAIVDRGQIE